MATEELKMVIDMISGLGDTAMMGLIAYFSWQLLKLVICWGCSITLIKMIIVMVRGIILTASFSTNIRDKLGVGCAGYLTDSEKRLIFERIDQLVATETRHKEKGTK